MPETIRIVCGVDFEEPGEQALESAIRLARRMPGSELHPVHVLPVSRKKEKLDELEAVIEKAGTALRRRTEFTARGLVDDGESVEWDQQTVLHVRVGDPAETLHQVAIDVSADMIVVGHQPRTGMDALVLGSVAKRLLRIAKLPVVVARAKQVESLRKTEAPDSPRDGETLHRERAWHQSELLRFGRQGSHISGLI